MSDRKGNSERRNFIKTLAAVPVAAAVAFSGRVMAALVTKDDPTAQALGYIETSENADQTCANCALYQGADAPQGACPLFPGKEVVSTGWCRSWAQKP